MLHTRVAQFARQWSDACRLEFDFRGPDAPHDEAEIRVTFAGKSHWSYIGTDCTDAALAATGEPTMSLAGFDVETPDWQLESVVLHEFGHALGLVHEHQAESIDWNRQAVIDDLTGAPYHWTLEEIESDIFARYKRSHVRYTGWDDDTVMLSPIPKTWRVDGRGSYPGLTLSATDRQFIAELYPRR